VLSTQETNNMSKFEFYAAVHKSSGYIRDVMKADDLEMAEQLIMSNWTERLKSQYAVERVEVIRLAVPQLSPSSEGGGGARATGEGALA
jgi:hypothetical protein